MKDNNAKMCDRKTCTVALQYLYKIMDASIRLEGKHSIRGEKKEKGINNGYFSHTHIYHR